MTLPISGDSSYFLDLLSRYRRDPASVPADWRFHFETLDFDDGGPADADLVGDILLASYRQYGHLEAKLDPLAIASCGPCTELDELRARHRLGRVQLTIGGSRQAMDLADAHRALAEVYLGNIAIEASHVPDAANRNWLYERFEAEMSVPPDDATYARTLEAVMLADEFESFIRTKWPTKKRFGIEGAESAAVILKEAFRAAAAKGAREVVIGGMHRGRLATLATVLGKSLTALIAEIKGRDITQGDASFTGDVPYHNGLASTVDTGSGMIDVRLLPHPSHLIVVAPVAAGAARARQELRAVAPGTSSGKAGGRQAVLPLLMHTDAAFSGQGLVSELLQLGGLDGYSTGGTIHLVVNNQIGFTTTPQEGRSSYHPTDIGKAYGAPILHVNGDDPIAAAKVARMAVDWRMATGLDIIIDLVCYRRNGHNELDEPRFTQPLTWARIDALPTLSNAYSQTVRVRSAVAFEAAEATRRRFHEALDHAYGTYDTAHSNQALTETEIFATPQIASARDEVLPTTGVPRERLVELARTICAVPDTFDPDPKVGNFARARLESLEKDTGFNMATGEAMAFASLLADGNSVRLSGQDSVRGTFTQRHLMMHDRTTGEKAVPVVKTARNDAAFDAINSPLSEYAVLAFEYGMSLADRNRLVVWEAQFGDFLNGAQVAVDQFITTAEAKWRIASNLVIALPHGLEGQGPDHSSARIERILQSCANDNVLVANPSTPANLFHLYRRQLRGSMRKPLFLIAPKSLLRQRDCVSKLADIDSGTSFLPVLVDEPVGRRCRQVVLCSGKIYYNLRNALDTNRIDDIALIRLEQLYPLPVDLIREALQRFAGASVVWCQEEPRNQGAWSFVREALADVMPEVRMTYVGRPRMSAAAGGSIDRHEIEQLEIVENALGLNVLTTAAE